MSSVLRPLSILWLALATGACNQSPRSTAGDPAASVDPTTSSAAPAAAVSGTSPATIAGPNGASLRREPEYDTECKGKKAYTGDTRMALPSMGCTGPMLVHFSIRNPDSGEVVDGEAPVFCCR